jgi:hypothetical protein
MRRIIQRTGGSIRRLYMNDRRSIRAVPVFKSLSIVSESENSVQILICTFRLQLPSVHRLGSSRRLGHGFRFRDALALHPVALCWRGGDAGEGGAAARRSDGVRGGRRRRALVPGGGAIDTHREVVVALARLEHAGVVVGGHVPEAAHF